jgi:hypothetical protein
MLLADQQTDLFARLPNGRLEWRLTLVDSPTRECPLASMRFEMATAPREQKGRSPGSPVDSTCPPLMFLEARRDGQVELTVDGQLVDPMQLGITVEQHDRHRGMPSALERSLSHWQLGQIGGDPRSERLIELHASTMTAPTLGRQTGPTTPWTPWTTERRQPAATLVQWQRMR